MTPSAWLAAQRMWLGAGLALAVPATAAALLTENARYLRVALLAVCWAFVIAAFLAGSRRADQVAAAGREAELRHVYDLELAREVAARHEYEAELACRLRRETEHAVRGELAQLRTELVALTELRSQLSGLEQVRVELGELRSDLGRMRTDLTEQLSGELLIERMVLRAQSVRGPARTIDAGCTVEGAVPVRESSVWASSPPGPDGRGESGRALGATAAEPLDVPPPRLGTPAAETCASAPAGADSVTRHRSPSPLEWPVEESVLDPSVEPSPRSPLEWLGEQALLAVAGRPVEEIPAVPVPVSARPPLPGPALRVSDVVAAAQETQARASSSGEPARWESASWSADPVTPVAAEPAPPVTAAPAPGHARLEQILAESGVSPSSGGRSRRRRYREEGEDAGDDVLARVLGRP